jgi:hypothetical protein
LIAQGLFSLDSIRTTEGPARFANHKISSQTNAKLALLPKAFQKETQSSFQKSPWLLATKPLRVGQEIFVN